MIKRIATLVAAFVLACGMAPAQNITSSIVGHVSDPSGAPIPGAQVTVKNTETGAERKVQTGADGTYSVPDLLAGIYDVSIART